MLPQLPNTPAASALNDLLTYGDADPRDVRRDSELAKQLRTLFEDKDFGLYLFAYLVFGFKDLKPSIHLPISQAIGRWGESVLADGSIITTPPTGNNDVVDSWRRLMVRVPREMFKSSLCTRAGACWTILRSPGYSARIGIFNEKEDNAKSWVGAIAAVVEGSHLLHSIWPDALPKGIPFWDRDKGVTKSRSLKWGESGLLFENDSPGVSELSIEPHGIGGAATGKHFTHKILDDIIGLKASRSQPVMQEAIEWINTARALERPAENGCELIPHTTWAYHDVYKHILERWPDEYKLYHRSLLENDQGQPDVVRGRSIFPEKISTAKAQRMLKAGDGYEFWSQYMCIPKSGRRTDFDSNAIRYGKMIWQGDNPFFQINKEHYSPNIYNLSAEYEPNQIDIPPPLIPFHWIDRAIILDPAPTKAAEIKREPDARNGLVVVGQDAWGRFYCFESVACADSPTEVLNLIVQLAKRWRTRRVYVEEVNFSYVYQPLYYEILRLRNDVTLDWGPTFPKGRDKTQRILDNLQPHFENGYWYFNDANGTGLGPCADLVQEVFEFPNSRTKDLVDALSYAREVTIRPLTPTEDEFNYYAESKRSRSSGHTGYNDYMGESSE